MHTHTIPGHWVVLFDGHCPFCTAQAARLRGWSANGAAIETVDFQRDGALERFPTLTHAECMAAMRLVAPDGRIFAGAEAVARLLATRWYGIVAFVYYVPIVRALCEALYAAVAKRRYRVAHAKRTITCDGTTCSIHYT